jgi:hypothetical protein
MWDFHLHNLYATGQGPSSSKVKWPSWLPIKFQASIEGVSQAVTHRYYDHILWSNFYITLLGLVIPEFVQIKEIPHSMGTSPQH